MNRIKIAYGPHSEQFGHLYVPERPIREPVPIVMIIHGGSWHGQYGLSLGTSLALDLAGRGFAVWNTEYRRVDAGGTWPEMSADVATALQEIGLLVAENSSIPLDPNDIRLVGHSAGGQLAVWLGGEPCGPGALRPSRIISQAGVLDLQAAGARPNPALVALFGGDIDTVPELYRSASPQARIPLSMPITCIHGTADAMVPSELSARYVAATVAAGGDATLILEEGEDHFAFLNPSTRCWSSSIDALIADPD